MCSCHACLAATMAMAPYHGWSMLATWPISSQGRSQDSEYGGGLIVRMKHTKNFRFGHAH